jgi:hypothetical protein
VESRTKIASSDCQQTNKKQLADVAAAAAAAEDFSFPAACPSHFGGYFGDLFWLLGESKNRQN